MLFFSSASGQRYGYDFISNRILRIPERWAEKLDQGDIQQVVAHLQTVGVIKTGGLLFKGPDDDWHKKSGQLGGLILNVTDACNLRCTYCAYSEHYPFERSHGNAIMSLDVAKCTIDHYLTHSQNIPLRRISIYGGEPSLANQLVRKVVAYARSHADNIVFLMNSNAVSMPDSWIDFLIAEDVALWVSIDGPALYHDRYRKDKTGSDTHIAVMNNMQRIAERAPDYYRKNVRFIATLAPPYQLIALYHFQRSNELLRHQGWFINYVKPLDTTFFHEVSSQKSEASTPNHDQQVNQIAEDYIEAAINGEALTHFGRWVFGDLLKKIHVRSMNPLREQWINGSCSPGRDKLFVDTKGNFFPCERSGGFLNLGCYSRGFSLDEAADIVSSYIEDCQKNCAECPNARFCSACYLAARRGNHFDLARKYEYCGERIKDLTRGLHIYTSVLERNLNAFDVWSEHTDELLD